MEFCSNSLWKSLLILLKTLIYKAFFRGKNFLPVENFFKILVKSFLKIFHFLQFAQIYKFCKILESIRNFSGRRERLLKKAKEVLGKGERGLERAFKGAPPKRLFVPFVLTDRRGRRSLQNVRRNSA